MLFAISTPPKCLLTKIILLMALQILVIIWNVKSGVEEKD
jgi:hypothetical protein